MNFVLSGLLLLLQQQQQPQQQQQQQQQPHPQGIIVTSTLGEHKSSRFVFDATKGLRLSDVTGLPDWIETSHLVSIRMSAPPPPPPPAAAAPPSFSVTLINGDVLLGKLAADSDRDVLVQTIFGQVSPRMDHVRRLGKGARGTAPDLSKGDVLRLTNGDEDIGRILRVGPKTIRFRSSLLQADRAVPWGEVSEIFFQPTERFLAPLSPNAVEVRLADGSALKGSLLDVAPVKLQSEVGSLGTLQLSQVTQLSFRTGAAVYLSDLEPAEVRERPFLPAGQLFPYRRDRSCGPRDSQISIAGQTYPKGLGVHAHSEITFVVDTQYRLFKATAGLDDSSEGKGSVIFVVLADGKEIYRSPLVAGRLWAKKLGGDPAPKDVGVSIKGVRRLTLRVECGPDDDACDRAAWADAILIR